MDEVENFFCQFPNPWALRVSGMGCNTSKCEKSQNHCTLIASRLASAVRLKELSYEMDFKNVDENLGLNKSRGC
jgi:hypothetical protein